MNKTKKKYSLFSFQYLYVLKDKKNQQKKTQYNHYKYTNRYFYYVKIYCTKHEIMCVLLFYFFLLIIKIGYLLIVTVIRLNDSKQELVAMN